MEKLLDIFWLHFKLLRLVLEDFGFGAFGDNIWSLLTVLLSELISVLEDNLGDFEGDERVVHNVIGPTPADDDLLHLKVNFVFFEAIEGVAM